MKRFLQSALITVLAINAWAVTGPSFPDRLENARRLIDRYREIATQVPPVRRPDPVGHASFGTRLAPPSQRIHVKSKNSTVSLVVGDDTPDETVTLTGPVTFSGDIVILNSGTLRILDAAVTLNGNVFVQDNGTFDMDGGSLAFQSVYIYQHGFSVSGNGTLRLSHTTVSANGYNLTAGLSGQSRFEVTDTMFLSVLTTSLMADSTAIVTGSNPLEWVIQDRGSLTISDNDGPFIFWPQFPPGSVADLSFPDGAHVNSFHLSSELPGVSGLEISMTLTNIGHVWWGMLIRSGADVTVRDSTMRTTGFIADGTDEQTIAGLVNGQWYADHTFQVAGSRYRLVNTSVETWNIYAWGAPSLGIQQCLFGEFGGLDTTQTILQNCQIDGSGGYLFTDSDTETVLLLSSLLSDTVANGSSLQIFLYSSILNGDIVATDDAIILLLNTLTENPPLARDSSLVMELNVSAPTAASTGRLLPLSGTADTIIGPDRTEGLDHWQLFYAKGDGSGDNWTPISGPRFEPVRNGVLGMWDTRQLNSGPYTIKLSLTLQGGFTLDTTRAVYLANAPITERNAILPHIASSILWQSWLTVDNTTHAPGTVTVYRFQNGSLTASDTYVVAPENQMAFPMIDGTCGYTVTSGPGIVLREVFLHNTEQGMAEFPLSDTADSRTYFLLPHYLADRLSWMGLALTNPGTGDANVTMTARDTTGAVMQTAIRTLPPASRSAEVLESIFPGIDRSQVARVDAESDQPVTGITISGSGNERLLFTRAIGNPGPGTLILPHIAGNWDEWANTLVFDNLSDSPRTATLTLYGNGHPQTTVSILIPAAAAVTIDLNAYREQMPDMGKIEVPGEGVAVRMSYRSLSGGGTAEFLLDNVSGTTLAYVLPGSFSSMLNWMGLVVANPGDQAAHLTLTGWKDGIPVAVTERTLHAHSRLVGVLPDLFSGVSATGLDRVVVTSDVPVTGLNISGWNQERLLFTPAVALSE